MKEDRLLKKQPRMNKRSEADMADSENVLRDYNGVEIPLSGTYDIDKAHTVVEFVARHLMISKVRGRFTSFEGSFTIGDDPTNTTLDVTIDAASISTSEDQRDGHLKSADFLEVDKYPQIAYKSTSVDIHPDGKGTVHGELTLHGITKPVDLALEFEGASAAFNDTYRVGFTASTEINREDFSLTWNQALEGGGVLVGKSVKIELDVQAIKR
jgi:polyisoprenoid-binding protein YceI